MPSTGSPYAASRCTDGQTGQCPYYFRAVIDSTGTLPQADAPAGRMARWRRFLGGKVASFAVGAESHAETLMHEYTIEVTRKGHWWIIRIPELDGLTQARWPGEIKRMARSYIAISTGQPIRDVAVRVVKRSKT